MYLKTTQPSPDNNSKYDYAKIMAYIENLKEEISFNLEALSKKIDNLRVIINKLSGGEL